jgi:hypothetical protein
MVASGQDDLPTPVAACLEALRATSSSMMKTEFETFIHEAGHAVGRILKGTSRDHDRTDESSRVSIFAMRRMAGAARTTIGTINSQESSHARIQRSMKSPCAMDG